MLKLEQCYDSRTRREGVYQYNKGEHRERAVQVGMIAGFHPGSCGSFLGFEACIGCFQIEKFPLIILGVEEGREGNIWGKIWGKLGHNVGTGPGAMCRQCLG